MSAAAASSAQAPEVQPREAAAVTPAWDTSVWEPHIAVGTNKVIAVFNQGFRQSACRIGYAVYDRALEVWGPRQTIGGDHHAIDSSVAFDNPLDSIPPGGRAPTPRDKFLAAALDGLAGRILVSKYPNIMNGFDPWEQVVDWPSGYGIDKPWIVAGERISNKREYYIVYRHQPPGDPRPPYGYAYLRTPDAGQDWYPNPQTPDVDHEIWVGSERVTGGFAAQPAVHKDGPLYVAYPTDLPGEPYRVLVGTDRIDNNEVDFSCLQGDLGPLEITRNRTHFADALPAIPRFGIGSDAAVPQLAVDPADSNSLYVAYQDVGTDDPGNPLYSDVNIYLAKLSWVGQSWQIVNTVMVNDDQVGHEADQFMPALTLTFDWLSGRSVIHVIFYDDRNYVQADGQVNPSFDVYYAWAYTEDLDFTDQNALLYEIVDDPSDPAALEFADSEYLWNGFEPGEYIGISAFGDEVWTSFTGTYHPEPPPDPMLESVIWSSRITWSP